MRVVAPVTVVLIVVAGVLLTVADIPGVGAISAYPLPLPSDWSVPSSEKVAGHVIRSARAKNH